jgi:hypothetical protein
MLSQVWYSTCDVVDDISHSKAVERTLKQLNDPFERAAAKKLSRR